MTRTIRLGSGSGFWGDALDPAEELLEKGKLDYLCFDFLAELTMALLQRQKVKDPTKGYVPDAVAYLGSLLKVAKANGTRLITNGGGANPRAAALALASLAKAQGLTGLKIALVEGDDLMPKLDALIEAGIDLVNLDTGETNLKPIRNRIVAANAYTDCSGIVEALQKGADVVICGRVSDNALYVGPIMHEFGWEHDARHADLVAGAITAGHVVECAAACTGGMSSRFADMPHMGQAGFPIIEYCDDGTATITKVSGSGGRVDAFTVKEQLVYEIADPKRYMMPDGIADFTSVKIEDQGNDRVRLTGMRGQPRPDTFKTIIGYDDGWLGEGILFFPWPYALERAQKAKETMIERFSRMGLVAEDIQFDYVGINMLHGPAAPAPNHELNEVGLRVAVKTQTRDDAEKVRRACSHLWIMGPGGTSFGTPLKPRPLTALWPTLVPRTEIRQSIEIMEV
ncbi:MAG: acyclic terpene utilization AtuA family protein [Parvibaculum sp.]|uniref:acyclic terpene utilization AtuA family protein n=1 Tax=Parvibaculum sp. TaxID=2024848 RepID=UPI003C776A9B